MRPSKSDRRNGPAASAARRLMSRAAPSILQKGLSDYHHDAIEVTVSPTGVTATVGTGPGQRHQVALSPGPDGDLIPTCSCSDSGEPAGGRRAVCEHVVTAATAITVQYPGVAFTTPARSSDEPDDPRLGSPEKLSDWAHEAGVEDLLRHRPRAETIAGLTWTATRARSLAELIAGTPDAEPGLRSDRLRALVWLEEQAEERITAREAEATLLADVPEDPIAAEAWERVARLRRSLRDRLRTPPLPEHPRWRIDLNGLSVVVVGLEPVCDRLRCNGDIFVHLGESGEDASVASRCTIMSRGCPREVRAVSEVMRLLAHPERYGDRALELVELLGEPAWMRTLRALTESSGDEAEQGWAIDGETAELGWQIEDTGGVRPVLLRPKKNGEGVVARRQNLGEVRRRLLLQPDSVDLRVAQQLDAHSKVARYYPASDEMGADGWALESLVGHPRVVTPFKGVKRVVVRRAKAAALATVDTPAGVEVRIRLCGEDLDPTAVLRRLRYTFGRVGLHIDLDAGVAWVIPDAHRAEELAERLLRRTTTIPAEGYQQLTKTLHTVAQTLDVALSPALRGKEVASAGVFLLRLDLLPDEGALTVTLRLRVLPDAPVQVPGKGDQEVYALRPTGTVHVRRDLDAEWHEAVALSRALELPTGDAEGWTWMVAQHVDALAVVAAAQELSAGDEDDQLVIEWAEDRRWHVSRAANPADLHLALRKAGDWYAVGGDLRVDGVTVSVGDLLAAVRDKRRFVQVEGERWVALSERLRSVLADTAAMAELRGNKATVSSFAAPAVAELEEHGIAVQAPKVWHALLERMEAAGEVSVRLPRGLKAELRDYQRDGYRWLCRLAHWAPGACLADDMGLGKTVQALALLLRRASQGPALVIAPTSVGFNWAREAERFAPSLRVVPFRGKRHAEVLSGLGKKDVVITSYDLLHIHAEAFEGLAWTTLVLDEAQAIKNAATKRAKAVYALEAGFVLALTGTPVENRTAELWSLFRAVAPGLLGTARSFRGRFVGPIERDGATERRALLARVIRPFILRRMKSEVASELPDRTDVMLEVELSDTERHLYDETRAAALAELGRDQRDGAAETQRFRVLAVLTRLRQLACHPRLGDPGSLVPSSKLAVLLELLHELRDEGHRALVFSQFTTHLALVREALEAAGVTYRYLDGSTPERQRRVEVDAFQAGEGDCFLLSLKAGGTGLNLTGADYVIHLDPWWNPAVEDQATDRAHRIGQRRPVTVYRLVSRDTIEEGILALHGQKRDLVAGLLDGTDTAGALSTDELVALIRESKRHNLGGR